MALTDKKNKKVTKYRRYPYLNIGTMLYGIVFIYMVVYIFMYLTETHIKPYEVVRGNLSGNFRYQALSLRTEEVVRASQSGSIRYYAREGSRVSADSTVCSVNESGSLEPVTYEDFEPNDRDIERLHSVMSGFVTDFSENSFQRTYEMKAGIESILADMTKNLDMDYVNVQNRCNAPDSGFVIYGIDGFEEVSASSLTRDMFDLNNYKLESLRTNKRVTAGDVIYKLITEEEWRLYFPMDSNLVTELTGQESIRLRFLKDNQTFTAPFSIIRNGSESFGEIVMDNSLVRYATDRFLEIELVLNRKEGLKVPVSAIVDKEFYNIPEEFAIVNEDTEKEITLKVERFRADGSSETSYVAANVYSYDEEKGVYLINKNLLKEGDCILQENSAKRQELTDNDVTVLHGVYNINKGYAVFREITVIDQNEEYCIVESNNIYGLSANDYIVLNASEADVDQIIN